jgi:hypothetical protein
MKTYKLIVGATRSFEHKTPETEFYVNVEAPSAEHARKTTLENSLRYLRQHNIQSSVSVSVVDVYEQ